MVKKIVKLLEIHGKNALIIISNSEFFCYIHLILAPDIANLYNSSFTSKKWLNANGATKNITPFNNLKINTC